MSINCNNQGAIALLKDNKYHAWTKHIDICYHFICKAVKDGKIQVEYIPTDNNVADIFTKPLVKTKFRHFIELLGLRCPVHDHQQKWKWKWNQDQKWKRECTRVADSATCFFSCYFTFMLGQLRGSVRIMCLFFSLYNLPSHFHFQTLLHNTLFYSAQIVSFCLIFYHEVEM